MTTMPDANGRHEERRLAALRRYDVLDTPGEEAFDRITRLARRIFRMPMATVAFLDDHRQWRKAREGIPSAEIARGRAFCDVTIRQAGPLIVPDLANDERFRANTLVSKNGIRFYAGAPIVSPDGYNVGTLCVLDVVPRLFDQEQIAILSDLARIVTDELELRLLATTDSLTGTLARAAFRLRVEGDLALALRHRHALSCILLDIDHFKQVNDEHGHAAGDTVLSGAAQTCQSLLRKGDVIGRIGGEEFAVVMPHTAGRAALAVADRMRAALAARRFPTASGEIAVTASFGVAALDPAAADIGLLMKRADDALYRAKLAGRNRSTLWQPSSVSVPARNQAPIPVHNPCPDPGSIPFGPSGRQAAQDAAPPLLFAKSA